jgi:protein-disulfide isomerase
VTILAKIALAVVGICVLSGAAASNNAARGQAGIEQDNKEILAELREIRRLLEQIAGVGGAAVPKTARLKNSDRNVLGRVDAPLTMIEITDLQCPFCREYANTAFISLKRDWIDTGHVRYLAKDLPLEIHGLALMAARASRCAGDQGAFWRMRSTLMANGNRLTSEYFESVAKSIALDEHLFKSCLEGTSHDPEIRADIVEVSQAGIRGTPAFIIGSTGSVIEGELIIGAQQYDVFATKLTELYSQHKTQ